MKKKKNIGKSLILIALIAVVLVLAVVFFPKIIGGIRYVLWLLLPFIVAYLISLLVNPLADALEKRLKLPRGISAIFVILLTVGVLGGIVGGIVWKIVDEIKAIYDDFPAIYDSVRTTWYRVSESLSEIMVMLPAGIQTAISSLGHSVLDWFSGLATNGKFIQTAGNMAKGLPGAFIGTIIFILSLYFMIADADKVSRIVKKPFSEKFLDRVQQIKGTFRRYVGGYVKAQLIIMSISFTLLFIGLTILDVKYALIIALVTAIFDALPVFGSGAVLWPWAIVSFITGDYLNGVGLLIIYFLVLLTRQFIEPKIVSENIGLHPIVTLISMYVGYHTLSFGGMILGPLTAVLLASLYKIGAFDGLFAWVKRTSVKITNDIKDIKKLWEDEGEE